MRLDELRARREQLLAELRSVDDAIGSLPEVIEEIFSHLSGVDVATLGLSFIEPASGVTDSRKNQMDWQGYRFRIEGSDTTYLFRQGDNWCSSFEDCGPEDGHKADLNMGELDGVAGGQETDAELATRLLRDNAPQTAVALLLRLKDY